MTRVLVVTAVELEAYGLARHLGLAAVPGAAWPRFASGVLEVVAAGLRACELTARAPERHVSLVISAGTCAALAPDLAEGAVVVPERVIGVDGVARPAVPLPGLGARGALLTVADVLTSADAKSRLWLTHGALAADMESAIVLDWARARGLPAAVVRGVSDTAVRGVPADLAGALTDDGRLRTLRAISAGLARPRAAVEAIALRAAAAAALKAVAATLATVARRYAP